MRSSHRCSMCPAIHIMSRSLLRSSSIHEPSDPPLRVLLPLSPPRHRSHRPCSSYFSPSRAPTGRDRFSTHQRKPQEKPPRRQAGRATPTDGRTDGQTSFRRRSLSLATHGQLPVVRQPPTTPGTLCPARRYEWTIHPPLGRPIDRPSSPNATPTDPPTSPPPPPPDTSTGGRPTKTTFLLAP